MGIGMMRFHW